MTLDRIAFTNLIGTLDNLKVDEEVVENSGPERVIPEFIKNSTFRDVNIIKPLGAGGFGLVKLVKYLFFEYRMIFNFNSASKLPHRIHMHLNASKSTASSSMARSDISWMRSIFLIP